MFLSQAVAGLTAGCIAVIPTDTLYGVVVSAWNKSGVNRLYLLRRRTDGKPFIILIGALDQLHRFGVLPTAFEKSVLEQVWPGKVSVVFPCRKRNLRYLHRGTETLAFRLPKSRALRALLKKTGPLVAPSANLPGKPPASTIREARRYFGDRVTVYVSLGRRLSGKASTLISLAEDGAVSVLRRGAAKIFLDRGGILRKVR